MIKIYRGIPSKLKKYVDIKYNAHLVDSCMK